ncbi:hypothetical protein QE177_04375 [Arsenophonus sp. aPb]|uniref:hypothetical protein n=1 Tax=Arsenophonus sp. aPb TaxID=3041619 RepID=UPI0024693BC2|nr:hypothetical protein [Arsenophonus sp. aPb]WGL99123.1 hypothetical protein QE177_04375 [Arsenophonus sp. aPb]
MKIQIKDIKCGDVFYAVKIDGEFPLFNKFIALSHPTAKQVKVKKYKNGYSTTIQSRWYILFNDYQSAKNYWIENYLNTEITKTMEHVVYLQDQVTKLNSQDDLE